MDGVFMSLLRGGVRISVAPRARKQHACCRAANVGGFAQSSQAAITRHIVRPSGQLHRERVRVGRRALPDERPLHALRAVVDGTVQCAHLVLAVEQAPLGPVDQRFAFPRVEALAHVTEIAAAYVRVVTYPFPGCIHHVVLSFPPTARASWPRPSAAPGAQAPCRRCMTGTALAPSIAIKEVRP
ncbi:hypothetical protein WK36_14830 [Burkholderia cepacia]|nr:hypothetical protein WK36_14830 [Burkholderia cepacia]